MLLQTSCNTKLYNLYLQFKNPRRKIKNTIIIITIIIIIIIIIIITRITVGLVLFGGLFTVPDLGGNIFVNFAIVGSVGIPANCCTIFCMGRWAVFALLKLSLLRQNPVY